MTIMMIMIMIMIIMIITGLVRGESLPVAPPTGVSIFFSVLLSNRQLLSWKEYEVNDEDMRVMMMMTMMMMRTRIVKPATLVLVTI